MRYFQFDVKEKGMYNFPSIDFTYRKENCVLFVWCMVAKAKGMRASDVCCHSGLKYWVG